jgi:hypothetical protein
MTKTEMMLEYEKETGKASKRFINDGVHVLGVDVWHYEYISWLENKVKILNKLVNLLRESE